MNNELSRSMQMFRVMDRMRRAWMEITPMQEMSKSQFNTLMMLRHGVAEHHQGEEQKPCEPMTLSELSSKLGQSMPAVSQRISKLESMGYVQRSPDLKDKRTVVLNLESTNKDIARRLIDFLSGVAYAGEGKIKKVAANTYIITPYHVDIEGDLIDELENNGLYF